LNQTPKINATAGAGVTTVAAQPGAGQPAGGFVKSFGCQMNVYDSQRIGALLADAGYEARARVEDSDVVVLNTCHIREKASEKVYSELGLLRVLKEQRAAEGRTLIVGVAGCVAQAEGAEILARAPVVDFVLGPQAYHRIDEALAARAQGRRSLFGEFETDEKFQDLKARPTRVAPTQISAFVTIQEGCDKFCSFCVVPYTRGAEVSRSAQDVIEEAERLVAQGVRELTLIGQNVNAYRWSDGAKTWTLAGLFDRLSEISGLARLRYTTSHPLDMGDDLVAAHRDNPKVMPYLHLPVQAGSDAILKAMNRRHTGDDYRRLIERIRNARPDIALSSDFIVGFPGESDADFAATMRLVRDIGFAASYSFKYSRRPGTPGAERPDQIAEDVKKARLAELQALLEEQRVAFNAACVGRRLDILFEKTGRHPGQIVGRTPYLQSVQVDGAQSLIGATQTALITQRGSNSLFGALLKEGNQA
jgi:tRNA-2-methylthio-N6-dimethylallyladenosine synthase